MNEFVDMYQRL